MRQAAQAQTNGSHAPHPGGDAHVEAHLERQVQEILQKARREAASRGRSVEEVIAEYGFDVNRRSANGAPAIAPVPVSASPQAHVASPLPPGASLPPRAQPAGRRQVNYVLNTPATDVVKRLVQGAVDARATDIHLEPWGSGGRARYRIDGMCQEVMHLDPKLFPEVVGRVKVLADLDVTERRRPQDGHLAFETRQGTHDIRVATVPAKGGEKIAMRLPSTGPVTTRLDDLGLSPEGLKQVRELIHKPFGMVLATGPVGSGKTTTLYACLSEIDRANFNVMSIEDPVEIELEGVNQLEVHYGVGFDFVSGLRAMLRQDPDAILVGEIRDEETARISVRASMTGLRVFSTLHTNDAVGAITSLRNFNLSPHLIASALRGVLAQRLLRRLCQRCKAPRALAQEESDAFTQAGVAAPEQVFEPRGCEQCQVTGHHGRVGVFEVFPVNDRIRDMILNNDSERAIRDRAVRTGMTTLQAGGLQAVAAGHTSFAEYRRILAF